MVGNWKKAFAELVASQRLNEDFDSTAFRLGFLAGRDWKTKSLKPDEPSAEELVAIRAQRLIAAVQLVRSRVGCSILEAKVLVKREWPAKPCCLWHKKGGKLDMACGEDAPNSTEFMS